MLDNSLPASKHRNGTHSGIHTLLGVEPQSSFQSFVQPPKQYAWKGDDASHFQTSPSLLKPLTFHAEPLAPLRQRDDQALNAIFEDVHIDEIVADICCRLQQLCPEPCWDDAFEFLQGYL
ncbi:MAG: hypothetical protein AAF579_04780 [Cyanobacteria bacterium P01_C01_bin.118]